MLNDDSSIPKCDRLNSEETDEEFARRMNAVGTIIEMEYRELYNIFRKTAGPADTHAVLAERYSGGVFGRRERPPWRGGRHGCVAAA